VRTFCVPCGEHNIKDWKEHEKSAKHQAWEESVRGSRNTYQGEPERKARDEDGNEN
jgi:hypothetical protein